MVEVKEIDHQRLLLERDRLKFERQKLAIEVGLKRRETATASRSPALKELFANPIALAIVGGFITLMTSILTTAYTASQNLGEDAVRAKYARESANETLQADLTKKFVDGPSQTAVRDNLQFLIDAGLLPTNAGGISAYLKANPSSAPQINAPNVVPPIDSAVPLASLPQSDPIVTLGRSVGRLAGVDSRNVETTCTAFLVAPDIIATAGHCLMGGRPNGNFKSMELK